MLHVWNTWHVSNTNYKSCGPLHCNKFDHEVGQGRYMVPFERACHRVIHTKYDCSIVNTSEDVTQIKGPADRGMYERVYPSAGPFLFRTCICSNCWDHFPHYFLAVIFLIFIRPSSDGTYYGMVMSVRVSIRPTLRPSVRPGLRPSACFPHFSPTYFDILSWNFAHDFVLMYYRSSSTVVTLRQFLKELCLFVSLEYR